MLFQRRQNALLWSKGLRRSLFLLMTTDKEVSHLHISMDVIKYQINIR